ncbi:MAG: hypothetical protein HYR98_02075 [Nitrospirae bacterium]|nr:hypothetical protein [Nitrospirota bacterium]
MFDQTIVPRRTEAGEAAMEDRAAALSLVARNLLVVVDGRKTVRDLLYMFRGREGVESALEDLFERGYIAGGVGGPAEASDETRRLAEHARSHLGVKSAPFVKRLNDLVSRDGSLTNDGFKELISWARTMYGSIEVDSFLEEIGRGGS